MSDWQTDIDAAHAQLLEWMESIGGANSWSYTAIQLLQERAVEAYDAAGWWFPDAQDYWDAVTASVASWPDLSGLDSSSLPGWDGFLDTVESATGAALTMTEAMDDYDVTSMLTGTAAGSFEDVGEMSVAAQEAVVNPGASPLAWGVGATLGIIGLVQLNKLVRG